MVEELRQPSLLKTLPAFTIIVYVCAVVVIYHVGLPSRPDTYVLRLQMNSENIHVKGVGTKNWYRVAGSLETSIISDCQILDLVYTFQSSKIELIIDQ